MKPINVSFDFDDTLSIPFVEEFAYSLIKNYNVNVWVCTARPGPQHQHLYQGSDLNKWNEDIFEVCDSLKIPREQILFVNHASKVRFLQEHDILWHLDDSEDEIKDITIEPNSSVHPIWLWSPTWQQECIELISLEIDKNI